MVTPTQHDPNSEMPVQTTNEMNTRCSVFASIPWGELPPNISPTMLEEPSFGMVDPQQVRGTYAGVRIKTDASGGVHIVKQYPCSNITKEKTVPVYHFAGAGVLTSYTYIPRLDVAVEKRNFIDYVVDPAGNTYVLESICLSGAKCINRLLKVTPDGAISWEKQGDYSETHLDYAFLKGVFGKLYLDATDRLLLSPEMRDKSIGEISPTVGTIRKIHSLPFETNGKIFVNSKGTITKDVYSQEKSLFHYIVYDISTGGSHIVPDRARAFVDLFGVDDNLTGYTYTWYNGLKLVSQTGRIIYHFPFKDVVVRNDDKTIYFSNVTNDSIQITRFSQSNAVQQWVIKPQGKYTVSADMNDFRLVHVDNQEQMYFHSGERPLSAGTVLVVSEKGEIRKEILPPFDLFSIESKFHYLNIQNDNRGNVYLPITDREGVKIVKLAFEVQTR